MLLYRICFTNKFNPEDEFSLEYEYTEPQALETISVLTDLFPDWNIEYMP
jgi:hypothetical protein